MTAPFLCMLQFLFLPDFRTHNNTCTCTFTHSLKLFSTSNSPSPLTFFPPTFPRGNIILKFYFHWLEKQKPSFFLKKKGWCIFRHNSTAKKKLTPTHNQHKERDSVWRIFGGWWQGGWTAPEFELEKSDTAGHGDKWRFTPCRTGERRAVYPAGWGNADCNVAVYPPPPPCRTGERRAVYPCRTSTGERRYWKVAVYPLPDGGTPNAMWRFTPLPDGGTPIWNVAVYPLPDGGTPIWIVAVYAGYGNVTATIANVLPVLL